MDEDYGINIDYLADVVIDQMLPNDVIPMIYVFDEVEYQLNGVYRFIGMHLADTNKCLSFHDNPLRNQPIQITKIVDEQSVEITLTSYEVWNILRERNEDLCKILWMPTVHLDAQYSHIITCMYKLIDDWLATFVIEDVESNWILCEQEDFIQEMFNKCIRVLYTLNTGEYIWEPKEVREYAMSLNLYFNENTKGKSITSVINALELKAENTPRNTEAEKEIDDKVRQVRLRLI